MPIYREEID